MQVTYQLSPYRCEVRFESIAIMNEFLDFLDVFLRQVPDENMCPGSCVYHYFLYPVGEYSRLFRVYQSRQITPAP